jgi:hypothetical protein
MIKVLIEFMDGKKKDFYAEEGYCPTAQGRLIYWVQVETGDTISYPVSRISEVIEQDVPE